MEVSTIFADLRPSKHWCNEKMFYTNDAAIALKDIKTGAVTHHRALVSSNLSVSGAKLEAFIYNENLDLVCSFKNIDMKKNIADADCRGLGRGKALASDQNSKHMNFSVTTSTVAIFAVLNLNIDSTKKKFPEIFK